MTRTTLVLLLAAVSIGVSAAAAEDPWRALDRPLHVPRIALGAPCPTSEVDHSVGFRRLGVGQGIGRGPVYPVGLDDGVLELAPAQNFDSRLWMGQKVLWFALPRYRGPALIRGRQLDGPYRVRFDDGSVPPLELRIPAVGAIYWGDRSHGGRAVPSYTRLRAPGCYGYQVDGRRFSYVVVFRAIRAPG